MLSEFITPDEVRAALGVSTDELEDATITLPVHEFALMRDLRGVDPSVVTQYKAVLGVDAAARTDQQSQFYEAVRLFSTYSLARQLCGSLPMFAPKEITDSKASVTRFSTGTFEATIKRVEEEYAANRDYVISSLNELVPAEAVVVRRRVYSSRVSPGYDPVTGS